MLRVYFSGVKVLLVEGRGEKLDTHALDSVLCKMTTFPCLIAPCKVMIISEMFAFIKWVWAFLKEYVYICTTGSVFKTYVP